jgi:multicomponent Na+:H+ antiporter subunit D
MTTTPAPLNFLIISTIILGMINLVVPFFTKEDSKIRNFFLITVSGFFLINIVLIDYLYVNLIDINFTLLNIGNYSIAFGLEPLGLIFLTMIAVLWVPSLLYTTKFLKINHFLHSSKYLFFVNSCILIGCIVAISANLITMFVAYEILTLCTIPLIAHHADKKTLAGLHKYLAILLLSGVVLFLPAIIVIYSKVGSGTFIAGGFIKQNFSNSASIFLLLAFIFGISKTAIFPLHGWLPAAMVASYPVSALLHAVIVVKTGLFCIYKILFYVFGLAYLQSLFNDYNWLVILPAITILYSSFLALRSSEIKMLLAYSTINQISIALISAFLLTPKGLIAAVIHMVSHSFTKICLFYSAGNFYSFKKTYYISDLAGIHKIMPKTSLILLIATLSLIGMPPFAGFISKFYIMMAAADQQNFFVMIILIFSSIFSFLYMSKIILAIYKPIKNENNIEKKFLPISMFISLFLCISFVIGFFFIQKIISIFLTFI